MVREKRAQFFSIYLVLLTLLMCGIVIGLYLVQQKNVNASVISPVEVLELRDSLEIYEIREINLIKESLTEANNLIEFEDESKRLEFLKKFRDLFLEKVISHKEMKKFILEGLFIEGRFIPEGSINEEDLFQNYLYPEDSLIYQGDEIIFSREKVSKSKHLNVNSYGEDKVGYNVVINYGFERKYLIRFENKVFTVEVYKNG